MNEFWAICDMVWRDDPVESCWLPDIAARYIVPRWSCSTQSGLRGAPAPGYCLFQGFCDDPILEALRADAAIDIIE